MTDELKPEDNYLESGEMTLSEFINSLGKNIINRKVKDLKLLGITPENYKDIYEDKGDDQ